MENRPRIAIVQSHVFDYRTEFYRLLQSRLALAGYDLTLYASPYSEEAGFKDVLAELPFAIPVRKVRMGSRAYWQPIWCELCSFDLVVVEQANAPLLNNALLLSRWIFQKPRRIAFWGHGRSPVRESATTLREAFKRSLIRTVDHWFAYSEHTANIVRSTGYPEKRITTVNNSQDTSDVLAAAAHVVEIGRGEARRRLGLNDAPTAVYCARLYAGKRLGFLLEACEIARGRLEDLQLLVIGSGPNQHEVATYARSHPWVKALGSLYGRQKGDYLAASDIMTMPSWVGLSILDGFAAGLPMITADFRNHGPELAYLRQDDNGRITATDPVAYASAIVEILADRSKLKSMSQAAAESGRQYSLEGMVSRFVQGVSSALADSR